MIYICTNPETVAESVNHSESSVRQAVAEMFCEAPPALDDCEYNSRFSDWHGGRMDQFYRRCGLVATDEPGELAAACDAVDALLAELLRVGLESRGAESQSDTPESE